MAGIKIKYIFYTLFVALLARVDASPTPSAQIIYLSPVSADSNQGGASGIGGGRLGHVSGARQIQPSDFHSDDFQDFRPGSAAEVVIAARPIVVVANSVHLVSRESQISIGLPALLVPPDFSQGVRASISIPDSIGEGHYQLQASFIGIDGVRYEYFANLLINGIGVIIGNAGDGTQDFNIASPSINFGFGAVACQQSAVQMNAQATSVMMTLLISFSIVLAMLASLNRRREPS